MPSDFDKGVTDLDFAETAASLAVSRKRVGTFDGFAGSGAAEAD
jgi:hypothetical protein